MVLQLPQDLFHLKGGDNGLNEHCCADRAVRHAEFLLRHCENVVPQPRLKMRLHLRQIVIRAAAALEQFLRIVEKQQCEIEDATGYGLAINRHVLFVEVPTARPRHQDGGFVVQLVLLAALLQRNRAANRIADVDLSVDHVEPGRAVGVLEVRHEGRGTAIQGIDDHFSISRPGNLDSPVEHVARLRCNGPLSVA